MKKKLITIVAIACFFLIFYGIDSIIATHYSIQVVSIEPSPAVADGKTPVNIEVQVTKEGKPVENHVIYILSKGGGSFKSTREKTDADGKAYFLYYPYLASPYLKAGKVPVQVMDESCSLFISVPAKKEFFLELIDPGTNQNTNVVDNIFGD